MKFCFLEPELTAPDKKVNPPASYLRYSFEATNAEQVILYMTALGTYHPYFNGKSISKELLLPGFTNYHKRVQYQKYDVTSLINNGENVIGCVLGNGWYRGYLGAFNKKNVYGDKLKFACTIYIRYSDHEEWLLSDHGWKATQNGPLRENDLKLFEHYDARSELNGWLNAGYDDSSWHSCIHSSLSDSSNSISGYDGNVIPHEGEPIFTHEEFTPSVLHTPDGSTVLDFGQNMAGIIEFSVCGDAGRLITLTMGETLDENGSFTLKNLQGEGRATKVMAVGQKLTYVLKDGRQSYRPHFLISGFRYAKVENWPEEIKPENFKAFAVYSDLKWTGHFSCSNELINQLVHNVTWSMKSNFVDIPTDCPQRERAGWTGDINVFLSSANYLADTRKFLKKWMNDVLLCQEKDGAVPVIVPHVPAIGTGKTSTGWGDAIATVPYGQYLCYGDLTALESAYDGIKKYVEYHRRLATKQNIFHVYKRAIHRKYILDTGFHFGEWLEPGSSNMKDGLKAMFYPDLEVATAWLFYTARLLSKIAALLGKGTDEKKYRDFSENVRSAYRKEFLKDGKIHSNRQCKYVRPVYMELADEGEIPDIMKHLNELCEKNDYRIGTGFLTTYQILNVLTDYGYRETAYKMLENEQCPGWLYEVKQGATTIWEGWDAIAENGKINPLSMNHYAPGSVISWLFSRCAGIRSKAPGYQEILIQPVPGGTLTWVKADYDSVAGKIQSEWKISDGRFHLHVELPENIPAEIIMPDKTVYKHAISGDYECEWEVKSTNENK